jgi:hypothetical protein
LQERPARFPQREQIRFERSRQDLERDLSAYNPERPLDVASLTRPLERPACLRGLCSQGPLHPRRFWPRRTGEWEADLSRYGYSRQPEQVGVLDKEAVQLCLQAAG